MDHTQLIRELYGAFGRRDAAGMMRCYHSEAMFRDPVFPDLDRAQIERMWTMLCERGKDLEVSLVSCSADAERGTAEWEAKYTFSKTQKFVHNKVRSNFVFKDGLIVEQNDGFDFWRWSRMALGLSGSLLGWTPLIKNAVRKEAMRSLQNFRS